MPLLAAPDRSRCSVYRVTAWQCVKGLTPYAHQWVDTFPDPGAALEFAYRCNVAAEQRGQRSHYYVLY